MALQLYKNSSIFTPINTGEPCRGTVQGHITSFERGALLVKDGYIEKLGVESEIIPQLPEEVVKMAVDCEKRCMIPGFVDPHTHCCFAGLREEEFQLRIAGIPYLEILKQGGGILSSVRAVSDADLESLVESTLIQVNRALSLGTTTMEIKSGYGLTTELELKMLKAIAMVSKRTEVDIIPTYLGAHAIPDGFKQDPDAFIRILMEESLPAVVKQGVAKYCDIFCEKGVFSLDQARILLTAAKKLGLGIKLHADEVHDLGGAGLAAELGAVSADHLLATSNANMKSMAERGVVANLLPGTAYSLRKNYARARDMIDAHVPVALATDCNPGSSYTESMQFIFGLAVLNMNMTPAEALTGVTLNAAYALEMAEKVGSLEVGKQADFLLLEGKSPAILAYHAGVSSVHSVYKKGKRVA